MYISGLIKKEFGRIKSDKRTLVLLFFIPLMLIIVFGLTSGGGPTEYFYAAIITRDDEPCNFDEVDEEYDEIFIDIVEDDCESWGLHDSYETDDEDEFDEAFEECLQLLRDDIIDVILILPEDFSETVDDDDEDTEIIYHVDGSDKRAVEAVKTALQEPIGLFRVETEKTANFVTMAPYLEYEVPFWETQILNYALAVMLAMIILGTTINLTTLSIVSEGPLPRMMLTPTAKNEIILSKLIANAVIMILQATEIFVLSSIFGLYCLGSLFDLYLVLILIGFCGISIGLFISAVSKTEQVANQLYIMFFIVIMMFSGSFLNAESLPPVMQAIINCLPLSHAIPLIVNITLKGLPIDFIHFISLLLISMTFITLAYIIFRFKKVEV